MVYTISCTQRAKVTQADRHFAVTSRRHGSSPLEQAKIHYPASTPYPGAAAISCDYPGYPDPIPNACHSYLYLIFYPVAIFFPRL